MKRMLLVCCCFSAVMANAQLKHSKSVLHRFTGSEKYFSFNPFGLTEPQAAIGIGYGNHFSERSEYFTELSYVGNNFIYGELVSRLNGARLITQYRYHLLQQWKPILNLRLRTGRKKTDPFIGIDFRLKTYNFWDRNSFVNATTHDTLTNVSYNASAFSIGGGFVFGGTYNIGVNGKWQLELTAGIGAKQKFVTLKDHPAGYEPSKSNRIDLGPPDIFEAVGMPYVPCTIRLRYVID